ncbi:MAG TPA: cation diffusion facilitator family transporter [Acidimicrobiales bacterium]|nr:cation diffusion facilitator family transporter [Acidimicrobiales bacterium]
MGSALRTTVKGGSAQRRLAVVLVLNLALVGALLAVGAAAHSLGVLAAGGDYLLDAAGVAVALLAVWLSGRPAPPGRPDAFRHATDVAALVNSGWLLVLEAVVAVGAVDRLVRGTPEVHGLPVLVVSAVAAGVMGLAAWLLGAEPDVLAASASGSADEDDDDGGDLSIKAVLLDTVADAAAAAGVAVAGAVIMVRRGWYWLDPAVGLAIAVVVARHAAALCLQVGGRMRNRRAVRS